MCYNPPPVMSSFYTSTNIFTLIIKVLPLSSCNLGRTSGRLVPWEDSHLKKTQVHKYFDRDY